MLEDTRQPEKELDWSKLREEIQELTLIELFKECDDLYLEFEDFHNISFVRTSLYEKKVDMIMNAEQDPDTAPGGHDDY